MWTDAFFFFPLHGVNVCGREDTVNVLEVLANAVKMRREREMKA